MSQETDQTAPAEEYVTFGRFLTRAREAKGLTLDDVAHITKIRKAILEAVETDARRDLPEKVFVLGYVRSYAAAVGLNVEEAVRRFQATWADDEAEELLQAEGQGPGRNWAWLPPTLAAAAGGAIIWIILNMI